MFEFDIDINSTDLLTGRVKLIESKAIRIGIKNKSEKAAIPSEQGTRQLPNYSEGMRVRRVKKRDPDYTLDELLLDLEYWGLFTGAVDDPQNQDLIQIFEVLNEIFVSGDYNQRYQAMLENAARALIRNRIIEGRLGNNSASTIDDKGFNKPLIDTGTLFKAIKAWLEEQ